MGQLVERESSCAHCAFDTQGAFSACRFCVGDRFYLCENKILCEYDYEERLAFANMALQTPASLAYIKRQLPPTPTPPGQNMHPGHNPLQAHQGLGQSVAQHNHVPNVSANESRERESEG